MIFDRDNWQEILSTIKKHKLRTGLTALGVFWGIFMLVFVLGMGKGLENGTYRGFGERAKNIMYVWPSSTTMPYQGFQPGRRPQLKIEDITAIKQQLPAVEHIAPRLSMNGVPVYYEDIGEQREVRGELESMINIEALRLYQGRYINKRDVEEARKVAVLGKRTADVLFDQADPIGRYIRVQGVEFRVVGIFGPLEIKPWTESDMEAVVIPLTTMYRAFGTGERVDYFVCSAAENVLVSQMEPEVRGLLKRRHHIHPEDPRGIGGFNLEERFQSVQTLFTGIKAFLWFVGIGTLLAGIVGVGNIMLITVKERTREIGIRKALGAAPGSIIRMVLAESVLITSVSGYLGLIAGTAIVAGTSYLMRANGVEIQNFYNPQVNLTVGLSALILLVLSGLVAGLIPARHAARINPVEALRNE
ncbi:MAG: FtsX-like permease family protein [Bacteroidetes bacterium]|jgi:putative ABC transport system permease protein|nr:FtsX-like permease family protein [Bacteroidota bacterium]